MSPDSDFKTRLVAYLVERMMDRAFAAAQHIQSRSPSVEIKVALSSLSAEATCDVIDVHEAWFELRIEGEPLGRVRCGIEETTASMFNRIEDQLRPARKAGATR